MSKRCFLVCALTLCLLAIAPVFAEGPIKVKFSAPGKESLRGLGLTVISEAGTQRILPGEDGTYDLRGLLGQKVQLLVASPKTEYEPITVQLPESPVMLELDLRPEPRFWQEPEFLGALSNDECSVPILIGPGLTAGSTIGATVSPEGSDFCNTSQGSGGDVWYTVIGTGNMMTASTCFNDSQGSADYDTKITVWCEDCDDLECVTGNDDSPKCEVPDFLSTVTWCSRPGVEYSVMVHGFGAETGNFEMDLFEGVPCDSGPTCLPKGACCTGRGPGTPVDCFVTTEQNCLDNDGIYRGDDTECGSDALDTCYALEVTMESMSAVETPQGVLIRWKTASEIDTSGFRLLRETFPTAEGASKTVVVVAPLISAAGSGLVGASYEFLDNTKPAFDADQYWIEDLDVFGRVTRHGPISIEAQEPATKGDRKPATGN